MRECTKLLLSVLLVGCTSCDGEDVEIASRSDYISFSPMYSAFDGIRDYAVTPSVPGAAPSSNDEDPVLASSIEWEIDRAFLKREEFPDLPAAIKLITKKPGITTIAMTAETLGGHVFRSEAKLGISRANPSEFDVGDDRYDNGGLRVGRSSDGGAMSCGVGPLLIELPDNSACGKCHNATSMIALETTPTQAAGYSDTDLIEIFTQGARLASGVFTSPFLRAAPMPDCIYKNFHTWEMTDEEKKGLVWKLRSLTPKVHAASASAPSE